LVTATSRFGPCKKPIQPYLWHHNWSQPASLVRVVTPTRCPLLFVRVFLFLTFLLLLFPDHLSVFSFFNRKALRAVHLPPRWTPPQPASPLGPPQTQPATYGFPTTPGLCYFFIRNVFDPVLSFSRVFSRSALSVTPFFVAFLLMSTPPPQRKSPPLGSEWGSPGGASPRLLGTPYPRVPIPFQSSPPHPFPFPTPPATVAHSPTKLKCFGSWDPIS